MTKIDSASFGGQYASAIATAFGNHGFMVGSSTMLTPRMRLSAVGARRSRSKSLVTANTKYFVRSALGVDPSEPLQQRAVAFGDEAMVEMSAERAIDLTGLAERLSGVRAMVRQPAMVGEAGDGPALLGAIDPVIAISEEVRAYVATLLTHDSIAFETARMTKGSKSTAKSSKQSSASSVVSGTGTTHAIITRAGEKVLERTSFACGCPRRN